MGVIKGFFVVVLSILLLLSIFSSILLLTLTSSLEYSYLQRSSKEIIKEVLEEKMNISSAIEEAYPFMQIYCQTNTEYTFSVEEFAFKIPCNITSGGKEAILDNGLNYLIKDIYYKEYNCEFIDCFKKEGIPTYVVSAKSYNFVRNIFYISLAVFLLFFALVFLLMKKKTSVPILIGVLLIVSSLPFFMISSLLNLIPNELAIKIAGLFFSPASSISLGVLILGAVLIILGIVLKILKKADVEEIKKPIKKKSN